MELRRPPVSEVINAWYNLGEGRYARSQEKIIRYGRVERPECPPNAFWGTKCLTALPVIKLTCSATAAPFFFPDRYPAVLHVILWSKEELSLTVDAGRRRRVPDALAADPVWLKRGGGFVFQTYSPRIQYG